MERREKENRRKDQYGGSRRINIALIGVGGVFIVLLIGAVIVMGSMLHQFTEGKTLFGPKKTGDYAEGMLVIRDVPSVAGQRGEEEEALSVSEISRASALASAVIRAYDAEGKNIVGVCCFGVVMNENGYILTSAEIARSRGILEVTLYDGRTFRAGVVGYDAKTDIGVLKIEAENLRTASFGTGGMPEGEPFLYVGLDGNLLLYVSEGILGGTGGVFFETDAGYSYLRLTATDRAGSANRGGVLVNWSGQIVGIRCDVGADSEGQVYGFAVSDAKRIVDSIIAYGYVDGRSTLGYTGRTLGESYTEASGMPRGVVIDGIDPESDLRAQGVLPGDIITAVSGVPVSTVEELEMTVMQIMSERVSVRIFRPGEKKSYELQIRLMEDTGSFR